MLYYLKECCYDVPKVLNVNIGLVIAHFKRLCLQSSLTTDDLVGNGSQSLIHTVTTNY